MDVVQIIAGIVIVAIIVFCIYIKIKKSSNQKEANEFINSFSSQIQEDLVKLVLETDVSEVKSVEEAESIILKSIYDSSWKAIDKQAEYMKQEGQMSEAVFKLVNKENVDKLTTAIIEKFELEEKIQNNIYAKNIEESYDDMVAEDKALEEKFSDSNEYNTGDNVSVDDLEKVDSDIAYAQTTDEEGYTITEAIKRPEDPVYENNNDYYEDIDEIVGEDGLTDAEREAGVHFDKNGRKRQKNGRFA